MIKQDLQKNNEEQNSKLEVKNPADFSHSTSTADRLHEGWVETTLGEVAEILDGDRGTNYPNGDDFQSTGYCLFLNTKNVPNSKFSFSERIFITKEKDELLRKGKLKQGDFVLTTRGTIGNFAHFHEKIPYNNIRINSGMVILRVKEIDQLFFKFYLKGSEFKYQVLSLQSGSAQPQLPIRDLKTFQINLPPLPQQKAIAEMLWAFDGKIELLREQNETLEKIGQEIFKEWFGKYKVGDDLPDGWRVGKLEDLPGEIIRGFTTKYVEKSNLINLNQKVNKGKNLDKQYFKYYPNNTEVPKNKFIQKYDILLNSLGQGTLGRVHLYKEETNNVIADQHISILRFGNKFAFYIYQVLVSKEGNFRLLNGISGSTGMLMLNIGIVRNFEIIIPSKEILEKFNQAVKPLFEKIKNNSEQIQTLSQTHDTLLLKLMNGEILLNNLTK